MDDTADDIDRISELPPFIIHQIMSYISAKEAAQTSILSKRWHCLQRSFPIFDFDEAYTHFMAISYPIFFRRKRERLRRSIDKFIEYVDASLLRFCELKFSMQKFKLLISLLDIQESSSVLDKWIGLVVENEVKELDFDVRTLRDSVYTLPRIIFSAKLLTSLKLAGCKLEQLPSDSIRFCSLRSLTLFYVCISEGMLEKLTSECLLLEELSMFNCWGSKCVHVSKAYKLKIISICVSSNELESIKIFVPSLRQLLLSSSNPQRRKVDVDGCTNINTLELEGFTFTDREFLHLISKFSSLENLKVIWCQSLERLAISSDRLKNLSIVKCYDLMEINIDTPNLVSFSYMSTVPISSSMKAPCPWKVDVKNKDDPDTRWYLNIKEFIGMSNQIEDLTLHVTSEGISFSLDEFRSSSPSAPCEVGNLSLEINAATSNYAAFLDGILNVCHPRTLSVLKTRETHNNFVEWLHEKMMNRDANCCNSHKAKCWRHYLNDFKIGGFITAGNEKCFHIYNLMEQLPRIPMGRFRFHLDWCFEAAVENA